MFIENVGQFDERARFQVRGAGGGVYLAPDTVWVTLLEPAPPASPTEGFRPDRFGPGSSASPRQGVNLRISFVGANPNPQVVGFDPLNTTVSYFLGNDRSRWRADVPVWGGVRYVDLYPGVDLEIDGESGEWAWRLVARDEPDGWDGGLPPVWPFTLSGEALLGAFTPARTDSEVRLRVDGAGALAVDGDHLWVKTAVGEFALPLLQADAGAVGPMAVRAGSAMPVIAGNEVLSPFAIPAGDAQAVVGVQQESSVAPPDLIYSTFLGGTGGDWGGDLAIDSSGAAYAIGDTLSPDFPRTTGALQAASGGGQDIFAVKVNPDGSGLAYAAFLGGDGLDYGYAIAVGADGAAYVTGTTFSPNFPTTGGAFGTPHSGSCDAFVTKLNAAGDGLEYSTFLGGERCDEGIDIAVPLVADGTALVTGHTQSLYFPLTLGVVQTSLAGPGDAFVSKLNASGDELLFSTYLGGSDDDGGCGIAWGPEGAAYVAGDTFSADFPTPPDALPTRFGEGGDMDAFVVKLDPAGNGLLYSWLLGGSGYEFGNGITVDASGAAYVAGTTESADFPATTEAFQGIPGGDGDGFVAKLKPDGGGWAYSTLLGGEGFDGVNAVVVDADGVSYVTGETHSVNFPVSQGAFQLTGALNGDYEAFVTALNTAGSGLLHSTYLGGSGDDVGYGIAFDSSGAAYVAGATDSADFPTTPEAYDVSFNGEYADAFVAKLAMGAAPPIGPVLVEVTDSAGAPVSTLTLNADGWPAPNPLTVAVTLDCPAGGPDCNAPFRLDLGSSDGAGRFYLYAATLAPDGMNCMGDLPAGEPSSTAFTLGCREIGLLAGQRASFTWRVWVQPSESTTLVAASSYGSGSDEVRVDVPQAAIHPIVFLPGLGATNPPQYNPDYHDTRITDWLLLAGNAVGYPKLYSALERLGYERNRTYFLFPYDWLVTTVYSAQRLRDELLVPAAAEIATTAPWVAGYGSPSGQDVEFDLIGHSTGNLVARAYMQGDANLWAGHVRRFVSLAGPHKGLPKGYTIFEGAAVEGNCIPGAADFDIACLAFLYGRGRAEDAGYGARLCFFGACIWNWTTEDKYLFIHDPLYDPRGPDSITGFLPTYTAPSHLTGTSGDFPYGRLANPLLEAESVHGSAVGGGVVNDPYADNPYAMANLQQRYGVSEIHTAYYGLNTPDKMNLLFERIGDPATNSNNVCLVYAGEDTGSSPVAERGPDNDTRVQVSVVGPRQEPPYWVAGARDGEEDDWWGRGDRFVPGVSGGARDIWVGTLLGGLIGFDLDADLTGSGSTLTAEHGDLVGYGVTHEHIAECLLGVAPSFLGEIPSGDDPVPGTARSTGGVLAARVREPLPASAGQSDTTFERALLLSARGPVELTLTDAHGRRLGYHPGAAEPWAEIPFGSYTSDADLSLKYLLVWSPALGDHALTITGTGTGEYAVVGSYFDASGEVSLLYTQGQITPGAVESTGVTVPAQAIDIPQPPDASAGPDLIADEGEPVTFAGRVTDINPNDTHTYVWDFGDGTAAVEGTLMPTHVYADDGVYTVTLTVTDGSGFVIDDTLQVTASNLPPRVEAGEDRAGSQGQELAFAGSFTDPGTQDTQTLLWDFGDGSTAAGTLTPTHSYLIPGAYAVTLTVTDDDGGAANDALTVTVANVAPRVEAGDDVTARVGEAVTFGGSFADPGPLDAHTIQWDFDDGTTASDTLTPTRAYSEAGTYAVTLTVTDNHGGTGSDTLTVTIGGYGPVCTLVELEALLQTLSDDGEITHRGAYWSLRALATAAEWAVDHDQLRAARALLVAFGRLVAQHEARGWLTADAAAVLRASARCVAGNPG